MKRDKESKRMAVPNNAYEAIHRLLATKGIAVLHKGQAPTNPFNLFDTLAPYPLIPS